MYYYFYLFSTSVTGFFFLCLVWELGLDAFCLFSQRSGRYVVNFSLVTFCTMNSGAFGVLEWKKNKSKCWDTRRLLARTMTGYPVHDQCSIYKCTGHPLWFRSVLRTACGPFEADTLRDTKTVFLTLTGMTSTPVLFIRESLPSGFKSLIAKIKLDISLKVSFVSYCHRFCILIIIILFSNTINISEEWDHQWAIVWFKY